MEMKSPALKRILNLLEEQRSFDFSGYRNSMLERRIQKRIFATKCKDLEAYLNFLNIHSEELDNLIDVFTINVSRFFRNSLTWEYIRKIMIPDLFHAKSSLSDKTIRIWSAGCSFGEEAYSSAIILNELFMQEEISYTLNIFATDIDKKALKRASQGIYGFDSVRKVRYDIYKKYFTRENDTYKLAPEIKKMVDFSFYDLLDKKHSIPPESIYGGFDLVFCRNVLIYFDQNYQKIIFDKLYNSLNPNGYLVLGEAEVPMDDFKHKFRRDNKCCKIYRKI